MNDMTRMYADDGSFLDVELSDAEQAARNVSILAAASASLVSEAIDALSESDKTMLRIQEAVTLGLTIQTAPDVVAFIIYRKALRSVVDGKLTTMPSKVPYPQGT